MHILIYDPLHLGHHLNWVRLVADACSPYAARITFATNAAAPGSPEFAEHLKVTPANFTVDAAMPALIPTGRALQGITIARHAWAGLLNAVRRHHPDRVYVPCAEPLEFAPFVHMPGSVRLPIPPAQVEAIFLAAPYAYQKDLRIRPRMRANMTFAGLRQLPIGRFLFIDPIAHEWLVDNHPSIASRSELISDPVTPVNTYDRVAARTALGLPPDGRWIGCVGTLDTRKGVDDLVASFAAAPLGPTDRLLLVGVCKPAVLTAIAAARSRIGEGRIFLLDRYVSDRELELAVSAVDLVAVTYRFPAHIGSASILIRATAGGRPVLASEQGWPGYVTRKHSLGWIYPQDAARRPAAIAQSLIAAPDFVLSAKAHAFAEFHSVARFGQILTQPLRDAQALNILSSRRANEEPLRAFQGFSGTQSHGA